MLIEWMLVLELMTPVGVSINTITGFDTAEECHRTGSLFSLEKYHYYKCLPIRSKNEN